MKKINSFLFFAALLGIALSSCKTTEEVITDPKEDTATSSTDPAELGSESHSDTIILDTSSQQFFASLQRSPCFGKCPTFTMTIYTDGLVEFEGVSNVDMIGKFTTTISNKQLEDFVHTSRAIGFHELKDKYDGPVSDFPSATITMDVDGVRKEVYRRYDYPKRILTLENMFDALLESASWKDKDGQPYPPER